MASYLHKGIHIVGSTMPVPVRFRTLSRVGLIAFGLSALLFLSTNLRAARSLETAFFEQATKALQEAANSPDTELFRRLDDLLKRYIDFPNFEQQVLIDTQGQFSADQHKAFSELFRTLILTRAVALLKSHKLKNIHYTIEGISKTDSDTRMRIHSTVSPPEQGLLIELVLTRQGNRFRIADITLEGASLARNYRASINKTVRKRGVDGLLARIQELCAEPTPLEAPKPIAQSHWITL